MNKLSTISQINMAIGLLYWFFLFSGFRFRTQKRYYRRILENITHKLINGIISLGLLIYGLIRMIQYDCFDFYLLTPFLFYLLMILIDLIYRRKYNKTFNLVLRNDLDNHATGLDKSISIVLMIVPFVASLIIGLNIR